MQPHAENASIRLARGRHRQSEQAAAEFERALTRISTIFAGAQWHCVYGEVELALKDVLRSNAIDHACIFEVLVENAGAYLRHVACASGMPKIDEQLDYAAAFPWACARTVGRGEVVALARIEDAPRGAQTDADTMRELGVRSLLHVPLRVDGRVRFVLTAGAKRRLLAWPLRTVNRLTALGEIFAHAIARAQAVAGVIAAGEGAHEPLDVMHAGRWEWDIGAGTVRLSDEAKRIFAARIERLPELLQLVDAPDRPALERSLARARAQPGVRFEAHYEIRIPDGETRRIRQWHEVVFPGARTACLIATVQDVTAQARTEREITELREHHWHSARVAQTAPLVASLAHELCQPLAAILNNAQAGLRFLNNRDLDVEEMRDILSDIVASNKRASEVLGALRAMMRRRGTTRIVFDIGEAVSDVLALVRSELMTEQIDVELSAAPEAYVYADKTQIEQVLLNLVMNAIDAMRALEGVRRLNIAVSASDTSGIVVSVKDTGRGIPGEKLPKVFEAFWTTKHKGLGVGLSLCRAIVESYGGRIWCEENAPRGAAFRFSLPCTARVEDRTVI